MQTTLAAAVSLTSTWFIRPGCESEALAALERLAAQVEAQEPDTLAYQIHTPFTADARLQAQPPTDPLTVLFIETYRDADAFLAHVDGPVFTGFVREHGALFVGCGGGQPFMLVSFLARRAGFVRGAPVPAMPAQDTAAGNRHPCGMFEIIAKQQGVLMDFYTKVFGWRYRRGTEGFAYARFDVPGGAALGGIGQADPSMPGYAPGRSFYLLVPDLRAALAAVEAAGGTCTMAPASADGYAFAMFADPEGNVVGLLESPAGQ